MSELAFTRVSAGFVLLAYCVSVVALALASNSVVFGLLFAIWTTSAVFWWFGWAMRTRHSPDVRKSAVVIGAVLALAYVGLHLLAWHAIHISSTGGLAYFTLPFLLLVFTIAATSIARAIARRGEPRPIQRSPDDEMQAIARDLARMDAKRAERASRTNRNG